MRYFLTLLSLDLGTKLYADLAQFRGDFFYTTYNKGLTFGKEAGSFWELIFPGVMLILIVKLGFYFLNKNSLNTAWFQVLLAGIIGNYAMRFSDGGVVDFIVIGKYVINLADIFIVAGAITFTEQLHRFFKEEDALQRI